MKLICEENDLAGMNGYEAMKYAYAVNVPIDMKTFLKFYYMEPHKRPSETIQEILKETFTKIEYDDPNYDDYM